MENKMEAIICSNVNKSYGKKEVLKNIDFTLEKGKIYGLIGRNGAGKTTLLSILSAQNPATEGNVTWNGEKIWENRKALDHICFSRELSTNLYGFKNILIAEAFVLCIAFGQICAVLQMRYGKKGIAVGIIVTVAVVMGIGAGFIMGSDLADTLTAWFQGQSGSVISMGLLIGAVVAAALYAVSLVMMLRVVSKYEVRV